MEDGKQNCSFGLGTSSHTTSTFSRPAERRGLVPLVAFSEFEPLVPELSSPAPRKYMKLKDKLNFLK